MHSFYKAKVCVPWQYDLSAKNPAKQNDIEHLAPLRILELIQEKEAVVTNLLGEIDALLAEK